MKIITWSDLSLTEKTKVLQRPTVNNQILITEKTQAIIQQVRDNGDIALLDFTQRFDKADINTIRVSQAEITQASDAIDTELSNAIALAIENITAYHQAQLPETHRVETKPGVVCERQARPIQRVGLYVPGGSAPLLSTVMMLAIPATLAQCPERILCTPPRADGSIDPRLLFTATQCGIDKIYKIGGAQAIAAMAYGTESVPKVDKIFGPGNAWVTQAKVLVTQDPQGASIDLPAGPSEVLVIADAEANPAYVAADLLSQAEHGVDSHVILLSTSQGLVTQVSLEIQQQLKQLSRANIAQQSLANSAMIAVDDVQQAIAISNDYAPEHLILQVKQPEQYVNDIQCAGAVFLGPWAPETAGDYVTGSNHVLPTYGYGRSYSGLSTQDFMTFISFQSITEQGLQSIGPAAMRLASVEGLTAHEYAMRVRLQDLKS